MPKNLSLHELDLANKRQKAYYLRNKQNILVKLKQDRKTVNDVKENKRLAEEKEREDRIAAMALKMIKFDKATLHRLFDLEEGNVAKPLTKTTIGKHKTNINDIFRILNLEKESNFIDSVIDPKNVLKQLYEARQIKSPERLYATSVNTGRIQSILFCFDFFFRSVDDINLNRDKFEEYKMEYDTAYRVSIDKYKKELEIKKAETTVISFQELEKKILERFGSDSKEYLIIQLYASIGCRDNLFLHIIEKVEADIAKNKNYILVTPDICQIILFQFKTQNKFPNIKVTLTDERASLVRMYIEKNKLTNLLFKEHISSGKLSGFIRSMLKKVGIEGAINMIRKIIISSEENLQLRSIEERLVFSRHMQHAPSSDDIYLRKIKSD